MENMTIRITQAHIDAAGWNRPFDAVELAVAEGYGIDVSGVWSQWVIWDEGDAAVEGSESNDPMDEFFRDYGMWYMDPTLNAWNLGCVIRVEAYPADGMPYLIQAPAAVTGMLLRGRRFQPMTPMEFECVPQCDLQEVWRRRESSLGLLTRPFRPLSSLRWELGEIVRLSEVGMCAACGVNHATHEYVQEPLYYGVRRGYGSQTFRVCDSALNEIVRVVETHAPRSDWTYPPQDVREARAVAAAEAANAAAWSALMGAAA